MRLHYLGISVKRCSKESSDKLVDVWLESYVHIKYYNVIRDS